MQHHVILLTITLGLNFTFLLITMDTLFWSFHSIYHLHSCRHSLSSLFASTTFNSFIIWLIWWMVQWVGWLMSEKHLWLLDPSGVLPVLLILNIFCIFTWLDATIFFVGATSNTSETSIHLKNFTSKVGKSSMLVMLLL